MGFGNSSAIAVLVAGLSAMIMSFAILLVRLERLSSWSLPARGTFAGAMSPLWTFLGCEFGYAAIFAGLVQLVQPKRPIDFTPPHVSGGVVRWIFFGVVMSVFGTRVISGGLGKLLPELDESIRSDGSHARWSSQYQELISARERAIKQILDVHFQAYSGWRRRAKDEWMSPLKECVGDGRLTFASIDDRYSEYLEFQQQSVPDYVAKLRDSARGASEDETRQICNTYLEFIWRRGDAASLHALLSD
jgi:hypothetical protein